MTDPLEQVVLWGENVTLHCQAASSLDSPMTAQWKKDNIVSFLVFWEDEDFCVLRISNHIIVGGDILCMFHLFNLLI